MFCKQCGCEVAPGTNFCTKCGAVTDQQQVGTPYSGVQNGYYANNVPTQPLYQMNDQISKLQTETMVNGILGLAFACSFVASFLGIVFSAIAKKKANEYIRLRGQLEGKAKVGYNLAKPGLIVGIIATAFFAIYIFVCFCIGFAAGYSGYYY